MPSPVFVLSTHVPYACARSGACCSAGWDIPVDSERAERLRVAVESGTLALPDGQDTWRTADPDLPDGDVAVLTRRDDGGCVLFEPRPRPSCAIQSSHGHAWLPLACQQFPRVALADDRGVHVTLSHFCPTAAELLFTETDPVSIERDPPGFLDWPLAPGLDARGHWPPLLRPGVLATFETWTAWEDFVVRAFSLPGTNPATALDRLARAAGRLRAWGPEYGPLDAFVPTLLAAGPEPNAAGSVSMSLEDARKEWDAVYASVPLGRPGPPSAPPALDTSSLQARVDEMFHAWPSVICRYLAARAFGSWCAYQGRGILAHVASVRAALGVLVTEFAAVLEGSDPEDERQPLKEAIRRADWLLLHRAESAALCETWSREA